MNILDENIVDSQRQRLRHWRIPVRHMGYDVGRQGMKDQEISMMPEGLFDGLKDEEKRDLISYLQSPRQVAAPAGTPAAPAANAGGNGR